MLTSQQIEPIMESLGRDALQQIQLKRLEMMLETVLKDNPFYRRKLADAGVTSPDDIRNMNDYRRLPFTTKQELTQDQADNPPWGTNLTFAHEAYTRIHQTSGTTGQPLRWLDTEDSWGWWGRCWRSVYRAAGVTGADRIFFAFSFGPFIGFWSAYEGARLINALGLPGGGMSSLQRLRAILANDVSVVLCTPTYALHLAEVAEQEGIDLAASGVRVTIHAGEPGASVPATKNRIERAWGARCFDHAGATEVGAWGFECHAQVGVHVNEAEFIAEIIDPTTGDPASEGELVVTNLGRLGSPIIRYRTGDRASFTGPPCACGRTFVRIDGGVVGRIDDVLIIRGVNVFPSAIENIVRRSLEVNEFAVDVHRERELDELVIRVEVSGGDVGAIVSGIAEEIRNGLGLRPRVEAVPSGTLPRFDLKARRITDHRAPLAAQ